MQVFIIMKLGVSSCIDSKAQVNKEMVIKCEKTLYHTLDKIQLKSKLNTGAEFYFSDICDLTVMSEINSLKSGESK